jgi:hypothetical protein
MAAAEMSRVDVDLYDLRVFGIELPPGEIRTEKQQGVAFPNGVIGSLVSDQPGHAHIVRIVDLGLTPPWLDRSIAWLADRRRDPTPINTGALLHRVEMRLRGLQVGRLEAFDEAIIHRLQQTACLGGTALILL